MFFANFSNYSYFSASSMCKYTIIIVLGYFFVVVGGTKVVLQYGNYFIFHISNIVQYFAQYFIVIRKRTIRIQTFKDITVFFEH